MSLLDACSIFGIMHTLLSELNEMPKISFASNLEFYSGIVQVPHMGQPNGACFSALLPEWQESNQSDAENRN